MSQHKVLLFGGSGTGKTTLIASMADQSTTEQLSSGLPFKVFPDDDNDKLMIDAIEELKFAFVEQPLETEFEIIDHTPGYPTSGS